MLLSRLLFFEWDFRPSDRGAIGDGIDGAIYGGIDSEWGAAELLKGWFVENGGEVCVEDGGEGRFGGLMCVDAGGPTNLDVASGDVREA